MAPADTQLVSKAKWLLGLGMLMFAIGQSLTFMIVAPLARKVGFSEQAFGIALTLASLPLIFGAPFWGKRSDQVGRKPIFMIGIGGSAIGTFLVAWVMQMGLNGWVSGISLIALFVLARGAYGAMASAIYPSATAYMVDITDVKNRGQGLAIIGAANGMGSILGPILATTMVFLGALVPMYVAAIIGLAGVVITWKLLPEPPTHAGPRKPVTLKFSDPRVRPFMIMWFGFFLTFMALQLILSFYLQDEHGITDTRELQTTAGLLLFCMAIMIVVVQIGLFQVMKPKPALLLKLLGPFFVAALVAMALAPTPAWMSIGFVLLGISFACANPGINGSASMCVEPWEQGAAAGFLSVGNTLGAILGPVVGTQIYAHLGHQAPMWVGAVALTAISLYAFTIKVPERSWGAKPAAPVAPQSGAAAVAVPEPVPAPTAAK
jgi:MFS transporter, DHA1 family, tetracycline resistance protein